MKRLVCDVGLEPAELLCQLSQSPIPVARRADPLMPAPKIGGQGRKAKLSLQPGGAAEMEHAFLSDIH